MSELSELNRAIRALDNLWPLLEGEEKALVVAQRNKLSEQADVIAYKMLVEVDAALMEAIQQLTLVTQAAKDAKEGIEDKVERINKVSAVVDKSVNAVAKLGQVIASL